jgi:hypothetical protein
VEISRRAPEDVVGRLKDARAFIANHAEWLQSIASVPAVDWVFLDISEVPTEDELWVLLDTEAPDLLGLLGELEVDLVFCEDDGRSLTIRRLAPRWRPFGVADDDKSE